MRQNTGGESKLGIHSQTTAPSRPINAAVVRSLISPWSLIGGYPSVHLTGVKDGTISLVILLLHFISLLDSDYINTVSHSHHYLFEVTIRA